MENILNYMGLGHSCGIHTSDMEKPHIMAQRIKVTKVVVNQAQSLVNSGAWTCGLSHVHDIGLRYWAATASPTTQTGKIC